nr:hypothetical protein CFP56_25884 [Quercus suber]
MQFYQWAPWNDMDGAPTRMRRHRRGCEDQNSSVPGQMITYAFTEQTAHVASVSAEILSLATTAVVEFPSFQILQSHDGCGRLPKVNSKNCSGEIVSLCSSLRCNPGEGVKSRIFMTKNVYLAWNSEPIDRLPEKFS